MRPYTLKQMEHDVTDANITTTPDNLKTFQALGYSRALRWQLDEVSLHEAVDYLEEWGRRRGLDPDLAQLIMARAFAAVRDDLGGWVP